MSEIEKAAAFDVLIVFHASFVEHYEEFRDQSLASMAQNAADEFLHGLYKHAAWRNDCVVHAHAYALVLVGEMAECPCSQCDDARREKEAKPEPQGATT